MRNDERWEVAPPIQKDHAHEIRTEGGFILAGVYWTVGGEGPDPEAEAYANLIAEAPALREALKDLLYYAKHSMAPHNTEHPTHWVNRRKQAIHKAQSILANVEGGKP